jgi:threonine dehydratase
VATGCRLVAEPSGAVATAAYLHHAGQLPAEGRFVAVVSGGNVGTATYGAILAGPGSGRG